MPQLYRFDSYTSVKSADSCTKIWITRKGKTIISHNQSRISPNHLRQICRFLEANSDAIIERWKDEFDRVEFFC